MRSKDVDFGKSSSFYYLLFLFEQNSNEQNLRIAAATKINAYTRSYLVRRILRTTEVQQIIQTIRDTLIFALNMHLDTKREGSDSAENIKLKARLLQQV